MKILAFAASNSRASINKMLVTHAATILQTEAGSGAEVEVLDLNDYEMEIFSRDRENASGIPALAHELYTKIGKADALLISFAEHNGSYAAYYKNIFDWMSRMDSKVFQNTPMILLSTSPGKRGGASVLKQATDSAPFFAADVRGSMSVGGFGQVFDTEKGQLSDTELAQKLHQCVRTLLA